MAHQAENRKLSVDNISIKCENRVIINLVHTIMHNN